MNFSLAYVFVPLGFEPLLNEYQFSRRPLPVIRVFRSKASSLEAKESYLSVAADWNTKGVASLRTGLGNFHTLPSLYRITLPL